MKMELSQYRQNYQACVNPKNDEHLAMFKHCTGGSIAVTLEAYEEEYEAVFKAHNVNIRIDTTIWDMQ